MSDTSFSIPASLSADIPSDGGNWHPLKGDWLEELAVEMQEIARQAQQLLIKHKRTDRELADALAQIKTWRQAHRQLVSGSAPEIVFDENLGSQLEPAVFIHFLLAQESSLPLTPCEFVALALLQEISGRVELDVVAMKSTFSLAAQHITLKISKLHTATVLLSMRDTNPDLRNAVQPIMTALLSSRHTQA